MFFSIIIFCYYIGPASRYPDNLNQLVEAFLNIMIEISVILLTYSLGAIKFYGDFGPTSHQEYFESEGGYIIIGCILILVLMSIPSMLLAAKTQPLF